MMKLCHLTMLATAMASTCNLIAGNYYCDETSLVEYSNVGSSGSYNRVTSFNSDGTCSSQPQGYSGSLAPFDEELSVHFRGPIQLEHFRVFSKSGGSNQPQKKRELHHRHAEPEPVYVTATDYTTAYVTVGAGDSESTSAVVVSSAAPAAGSPSSSAAPAPAAESPSSSAAPAPAAPSPTSSADAATTSSPAPETSTHPVYNYNYNHEDQSSATGPSVITRTTSPEPATTSASSTSSSSSAPQSSSSSSSQSQPSPSGSSWSQVASYDAGAGSSNGLVFLNNLGGGGSGVFDFSFGNSLSYATSDGTGCASSPQTLSQTTVPSNKEFIIFTDDECSNGDCGYTRPGTVAYHGFDGAYKVFVFEFGMPTDSSASGFNADMPAVWLLNAQIPRTLQYGPSSCSCWKSGCGELDLFEVLNSGNNRLTNSVHDNKPGGTGNYFARPTQGTLKAAAVFDGEKVTIVEIPEIPDSIDDGTISWWIQQAGNPTPVSL